MLITVFWVVTLRGLVGVPPWEPQISDSYVMQYGHVADGYELFSYLISIFSMSCLFPYLIVFIIYI
jgi:hypothetical protein